jgi:LPXTG-site transpeptidase (sortase) family protein
LALLLTAAQSAEGTGFADDSDIGDWARAQVSALKQAGIVAGYGDNAFRPQSHVTRAEFAVMFMKIRDAFTVNDITYNAAINAAVSPMQYLAIPDGAVGVLSLPSLGLLDLPVVEDGENLDNIKNVAGHFVNTAIFDGNVGILGHNFTDKSPWFGELTKTQIGDIIVWKTKFGVRQYQVTTKQSIDAEDWSDLMETGDNRITLITCLAGQAQTMRVMVQGTEITE